MQLRHTVSAVALGVCLATAVATAGLTRGATPPDTAAPPTASLAPTSSARPALGLSLRGLPLLRGRSGAPVEVALRIGDDVDDVDLRVVNYGGSNLRQLAEGPRKAGTLERSWDGRDERGRDVSSGAYRVVATVTRGDARNTASEWVTVAERKIYPRRPGFISVAVDPGHGGSLDGAVGKDGTREADLNLDIGLRLARMLEGAGIDVAITRTTDTDVNMPAIDLTGDGLIDDTDELAARPDIANKARADIFISVHNNTAVNKSVGGPSTLYSDERPFTDRSLALARAIQDELMKQLSRFRTPTWQPFDHGVLIYPYYVLRGFDPPRLQRPTQMPGVLSEGLFLSHPTELRLLKQPAVRQAIAQGYYDAIATYLSGRATQVGYVLFGGPREATTGEELEYVVEVRNKGNEPMAGWRLRVGALRDPFMYEGRGRAGQLVGSARVPRLEPGESTTVSVAAKAPDTAATWALVFDATDRKDKRASRSGSPPLQVPLVTVAAEPVEPGALGEPDPSAPAASTQDGRVTGRL